MKKKSNQVLALLLAAVLALGCLPPDAIAAEPAAVSPVAGEAGVLEEDPIVISEPTPVPEPSAEPTPDVEPEPTPEPAVTEPAAIPSPEPSATAESAPALRTKSVETELETVYGDAYTIQIEYDESAGIPDGAVLSVVEVNVKPEKLPENSTRPYPTETWVTSAVMEARKRYIAEGLDVEPEDHVFFTKLLDLSLTYRGRAIAPRTAVRVVIETDGVELKRSPSIEAAMYDPLSQAGEKRYKPVEVENLSNEEDGVKLAFETEQLTELGLMGVAGRLLSWETHDMQISVLGPRSKTAEVVQSAMTTPEAGVFRLAAFHVELEPAEKYDTALWIAASPVEEPSEDIIGSVLGYQLYRGARQRRLFGAAGTVAPVAVLDKTDIGLVWDTGYRSATLTEEDVTLTGVMPRGASAEIAEVSGDYDALVEQAAEDGEATAIAAYDITITANDEEYQPDPLFPVTVTIENEAIDAGRLLEVWHILDDGTVEIITNVTVVGHTASFLATGFSTYLLVERGERAMNALLAGDTVTITWKNDDGTVLATSTVEQGTEPEYPGTEPTKAADAQHTYTFAGWNQETDPDTGAVTYTAFYTQTLNTYTVTWRNDVGTVLETDNDVEYGTMPTYDGETPTKHDDENGIGYTFTGWSPAVVPVTGNVVYTAQFTNAAVEIFVRDDSDATSKPIQGATLQLENSGGTVLWSGTTDETGILFIPRVPTDQAGGNGATFAKGNTYTLRQTETDDPYFLPKGTWTIKVDAETGAISMTKDSPATDYTTTKPTGPFDIRFYISNVRVAHINFDYNYPAGSGGTEENRQEALSELSYSMSYTIKLDDPALEGYDFVGWVDANNAIWKSGATLSLNTNSIKEHNLTAAWRVPLNVQIMTYSGNVASQVDENELAVDSEINRSYTDLTELGKAYGDWYPAAAGVTNSDGYDFVQAKITPATGDAFEIVSMEYYVTGHVWRYRRTATAKWEELAVGDTLALYYASNAIHVQWVEERNGSFQPMAGFDNQEFVVHSDRWYTLEDLLALTSETKADAQVEGRLFFQYVGFGTGDSIAGPAGLMDVAPLRDFYLKNSGSGFLYSDDPDGSGSVLDGMSTIYLVYSATPPEGSAYLDIENNTKFAYDVSGLLVDGVDVMDAHRAILVSGDAWKIFDGATGDKHAGTTVAANGKAQLVLLDVGTGSFTVQGGFAGTTSAASGTQVSVGVAEESADVHTISRRTPLRLANEFGENELLDTSRASQGTLTAADGHTIVTFSQMPGVTSLELNKLWSDDVYPAGYRADFAVYEVGKGDHIILPDEIPLTNQDGEDVVADALRDQGYTVRQLLNPNDETNGYYTISESDGMWKLQVEDLPGDHLYYAVEKAVRFSGSSDNQIGRFDRGYDLAAKTVTNTRVDNVCRVGDVGFPTIQAAVAHIESGTEKEAVIEMLQSYIMLADKTVTIPADCQITLTTAEELPTAIVRRGFSGDSLFTVASGGSLAIQNVTLDGRVGSTQYTGRFVSVQSGGTVTVQEGALLRNALATDGSAIYAENGGQIAFTGGKVQNNRATGGGAVGVGGVSVRISLSGNTVIYGNTGAQGPANIYLNQPSDEILQIVGAGLGEEASVGVYVPDGTAYDAHGCPAKPFATYADGAGGLDKLINDRFDTASPARYGHSTEELQNKAVWGETFSLTVDLRWLDEAYQQLADVPEGASATLALKPINGSVTKDEDSTATTEFTHTFRGLARYDAEGEPCEYWIDERSVLPTAYHRVVFLGDKGAEDQPFVFAAAGGDVQKLIVSNAYGLTSFTVKKTTEDFPESITRIESKFTLYRVKKYGVGSAHDLPNGLRSEDTPEAWLSAATTDDDAVVELPATKQFFTLYGGNEWYCQVAEGSLTGAQLKQGPDENLSDSLVKFHRFYNMIENPELVISDLQNGDVKYDRDGYAVYSGGTWVTLDYTSKEKYPDVNMQFIRQDGYSGAESVKGESAGQSCTITIDGNGTGSHDFTNLPADYYYYAIETGVEETGGRSLSGSDELVAAYDPQYAYDKENRTLTVTNKWRDVALSVTKVWKGDMTQGNCEFEVYMLTPTGNATIDLSDPKQYKSLVEDGTIDGVKVEKIDIQRDMKLPKTNGSWVDVITKDYLEEKGLYQEGAVYFARETTANTVPITNAQLEGEQYDADTQAAYGYDKIVNMVVVTNLSSILCKIVDSGVEHSFRSLQEAYAYGTRTLDEFTIEMLRDYQIPADDTLTIEAGKTVTLTTASTVFSDSCQFTYSNADKPDATRATLARGTANTAFITVTGSATATTGLVLENIAFDGRDQTVNDLGGFVKATNASVTLRAAYGVSDSGVVMTGGRAYSGGAIYANGGAVSVSSASFTSCVSTRKNNEDGGGAIWASGTLTVSQSTFDQCTAQRSGGGVFHYNKDYRNTGNAGTKTNISGCTFTYCATVESLDKDTGGGGAVCSQATELYVDGRCVFENCGGLPGFNGGAGGVLHLNKGDQSFTSIKNASFTDCKANNTKDKMSSGAFVSGAKTLLVEACAFTRCQSQVQGGAFNYYRSDEGSSASVVRCIFTDCQAPAGAGGAFEVNSYEVTVEDSTFTGCYAQRNGGAVNAYAANNVNVNVASSLVVSNCTFTDCYVSADVTGSNAGGGAVRSTAKSTTILDSHVSGCHGRGGGAIYCQNSNAGSETIIQGCEFVGCTADTIGGGAVYSSSRTLTVEKSESGAATTFDRCTSTTENGGGVYTSALTVKLDGAAFSACTAKKQGGGLWQGNNGGGSSVAVTDSSFVNCTASGQGGGGLYSTALTATFDHDTFASCTTSGGEGGGVYTTATTATFRNGTSFTSCTASSNGGGFSVNQNSATVNVSDCAFSGCSGTAGGGFRTTGPSTTVLASSFMACKATNGNGGAIASLSTNVNSKTTVEGCTFGDKTDDQSGCTATGSGGAIYTQNDILQVADRGDDHSGFAYCTSNSQGGAIYHLQNRATTSSATLINVSFDSCATGGCGGALRTDAANLTATGCTVTDCQATAGGGGVYHSNGTSSTRTEINDCTFQVCVVTASQEGGGLWTNTLRVEIAKTRFIRCETKGNQGGGLSYGKDNGAIEISDTAFEGCTAVTNGGGAQINAPSVTVSGSRFTDCQAQDSGGGLLISKSGATTVTSTTFTNCKTTGSGSNRGGGGIAYTADGGTLSVIGCTFTACTTASQGGGVFTKSNLLAMDSYNGTPTTPTTLTNCTATYEGGGIYHNRNANGSETKLTGCTIDGGVSATRSGGGLYTNAKTLTITGCTVKNCTSGVDGGGVYSDKAEATITGVAIANNTASHNGGGLYQSTAAATLVGCAVSGNSAGTSGGGVYFTAENNPLTLQACQVTENKAGTFGGGVYFESKKELNLNNGTSVTGNTIDAADAGKAAGIYMSPKWTNGVLVLGDESFNVDIIRVYDNKTAGGSQSNVRLLWTRTNGIDQDKPEGVELRCSLVESGENGAASAIGVCNPGPGGTQFGVRVSTTFPGAECFESDDGSVHGTYDTRDSSKLIWYVQPVCKITDANGTLLTYGDQQQVARFGTLKDAVQVYNEGVFWQNDEIVEPAQIQMITTGHTWTEALPELKRDVTITTAAMGNGEFDLPLSSLTNRCTLTRGYHGASLFTVGVGVSLTLDNITLNGNGGTYASTTDGGLIHAMEAATVVLGKSSSPLLQSSKADGKSGGAVYLENGASLTMAQGAQIQGCSAGTGGGVYLGLGCSFDMRDAAVINACSADKGGAVYVEYTGTMSMDVAPIITNNHVTTESGGAGIYLAGNYGGALKLQAKPIFANNTVTTAYENKTIGGEAYVYPRQDVYLATSAAPASSIQVTGDITSGERSIWVFAEAQAHYGFSNQFAVIASGVEVSDATLHALANARDDVTTENKNGQSLVGAQKDIDGDNNVYWGLVGLDVSFRKIDGFGEALSGAEFRLYLDAACKTELDHPAAVSANGATDVKATGELLEKGEVLFDKVPDGVYYMKETATPAGQRTNENTYIVLVGAANLTIPSPRADLWTTTLSDIQEADVARQTGQGEDPKDYAIFLLDGEKATAAPDIAQYGVMNESDRQRKVILRKIDSSHKPLANAKLEILRYDRTLVLEATSYENGAFFIGELPYGTYYLHETGYPEGVKQNGTAGWWYKLTINEAGAACTAQLAEAP